MGLAIKLSLLAAGVFLLFGMLSGVIKYRYIMTSPSHNAPAYIDIAHRASFLYSFAALVIAKLLEYSPYSNFIQILATIIPLTFFTLTIVGYFITGLQNQTDNLFSKRNFISTWFMYLLIPGEILGMLVILWGFISTQFFS
ncbi:MAG: hypothetical protein IPK14_18410 [Blastocatellia bacterium]|nr:hypothetical protein [Blastocatellia bacterium]